MREGFGAAAMAILVVSGCGAVVDPADGISSTEESLLYRCPDPSTDCTMSNGTGVYTAEDGYAGIDNKLQMMITHFINNPASSTVTFQGRYYNPNSQWWLALPTPGTVYRADFRTSTNLKVKAVTELGTNPVWTLYDSVNGTTLNIGGSLLLDLKLYINFVDPLTSKVNSYFLTFDSASADVGKKTVRKFNMRWTSLISNAKDVQYCEDDQGNPDTVVFQKGIFVNPTTAVVHRNATTAQFVTMSCRLGGPATVYWWGYDHLNAPWYFDAGLHMKRASYCADSRHYTITGTKIAIADGLGVQGDPISTLEAYWTPAGATCLGTMRHPELNFNGYCNGVKLPPCPDVPPAGQWLTDGVQP